MLCIPVNFVVYTCGNSLCSSRWSLWLRQSWKQSPSFSINTRLAWGRAPYTQGWVSILDQALIRKNGPMTVEYARVWGAHCHNFEAFGANTRSRLINMSWGRQLFSATWLESFYNQLLCNGEFAQRPTILQSFILSKKLGRKSLRLNLFLRFDLSFLKLGIIVLEHWHNLAESEVIKYSEISVYKTKKIK